MLLSEHGLHHYTLETQNSAADISMQVKNFPELDELFISLDLKKATVPKEAVLHFAIPLNDIEGLWHPAADTRKTLRPDWLKPLDAHGAYSAPIMSLFNGNGENRLTFACSDAMNIVRLNAGVHEETAQIYCSVFLMDAPMAPLTHYEAIIRIDQRPVSFSKAVSDTALWWETLGYTPLSAPDQAYMPFFSTWYSMHQNLTKEEIEDQCKAAKALGCQSVIVDDGWQTDDNRRGYAYCGDWVPCAAKMGDMHAHVARVHGLGLKYLLWYSVPFIGIHSTVFEQFEPYFLLFDERRGAGTLDPRYPHVREYLIRLYESAFINWDIDGLKLDFVDAFFQPNEEKASVPPGRDTNSVPQAVDWLMKAIVARILAIKPAAMIEFRQNYIGPAMRCYGNLFRAADCPGDRTLNRIRTVDIRLMCGHSVVHSDMLMWHPDERPESAIKQLLNVYFAVPQISMDMRKLPKGQQDAVAFHLNRWLMDRKTLFEGQFTAHGPHMQYPLVTAEDNMRFIAAVYGRWVIMLPSIPHATIINASDDSDVFLVSAVCRTVHVHVYTATGELIRDDLLRLPKGPLVLPVPCGGVIDLREHT